MKTLSIEYLTDAFVYCEEDGALRWKHDRRSGMEHRIIHAKAGEEAGFVRVVDGISYRHINLSGKHFAAHRIVWAMCHKRWPSGVIDHIDGNGLNNRIANLRECTNGQNMRNRKLNCNTKSGFKGVHLFTDGVWRARVSLDGKKHSLGLFKTAKDAATAYDAAAIRLHGPFARTNKAMGLL